MTAAITLKTGTITLPGVELMISFARAGGQGLAAKEAGYPPAHDLVRLPVRTEGGGRELTGKSGRAYNPRMDSATTKNDKLARDSELVALITQGDQKAWEMFVENFTNWALYKAREWCVGHCPYSAGEYFCGLTSLSLQRQGRQIRSDAMECDEGLDTYIWIFEQLKRRVARYTGKNDCLLSTYVWTILNSKELHIDWLRWKYGRVF